MKNKLALIKKTQKTHTKGKLYAVNAGTVYYYYFLLYILFLFLGFLNLMCSIECLCYMCLLICLAFVCLHVLLYVCLVLPLSAMF